ncbi:MAG: 50S ribosomal protein L29 [Candidatus Heimdallarchaeota archaeon]|nr:50S ribosomal protein L29 [Candidatus Heimdallarchaeota archaeon]MDH5646552.1 50S ribosomal protein L29 [Candidatus Heimdallarchaeota archaeon]
MAIIRMKEIRKLNPDQRNSRLEQYRKELMGIKSQLSAGGSISNPSKIKELKVAIAKILTVNREEELKAVSK